MFKLNNTPIGLDQPFTTEDGTSYPSNWIRLATQEERAAIGITEVDDPASYDDRFFWSAENPKQLEDIEVTPEEGNTYTQKGLKSQWTAQVKDTAGKLLAESDWMVIRKAERNVDIPADTVAYRAAVVVECARLEQAITDAADVPALIAVVTAQQWPEA